jgi:hypothetical protein
LSTETVPVYFCGNENRRQAVRSATGPGGQPLLNGIDFLEVDEASQTVLHLTFIHPLPGEAGEVPAGQPALTSDHFELTGGERVTGIKILSVASDGNRLRLVADRPGDFSHYTLHLLAGPGEEGPPPGYDPRLSTIRFSFKAACPSPFDCQSGQDCESAVPPSPRLDYLARDYESYRRLLLDRLRLLMPDYQETSPADFPIALTELLAYAGDQMAYAQDANATETYLGTALQRVSVKRHARLRDYWMHEGCNARTWVQVSVEAGGASDGLMLKTGTGFFAGRAADLEYARAGQPERMDLSRSRVFESMETLALRSAHNQFSFYTWSDTECTLCKGARSATLRRNPGSSLAPGMVLVFEEVTDPLAPAGSEAPGRPEWRWPVRLTSVEETTDILTGELLYAIEWAREDALPFSFVISRRIDDILVENITLACGNIVLADHGLTLEDHSLHPELHPPAAPLDGSVYRPVLEKSPLSHRQSLADPQDTPASRCTLQDPAQARPALTLHSNGEEWNPVGDLLGSDENAAEFVVETGNRRESYLRFGTGEHGRAPSPGQSFRVRYRIGSGTAGNIGADSLSATLDGLEGILRVRNPLPARGGTDPESIEQVKQFAPVAFRTQNRAVTLADYEEMARRYPGVQQAKAQFRWLASWYTVMLVVDRTEGREIDQAFRDGLIAHMERFRMTGYDLEVRDPVYVPLHIQLEVCLRRGADGSAVHRELSERLGPGSAGLFHPGNLTFGQRIYGSRIIAEAMQVSGIDHARLVMLKRFREPAGKELEDGYLEVSGLELPRLANDPSQPERGKIEFILKGGF